MDFNQPPSVTTKDDVARKIAEARQEAGAVPVKPAEGGLDDLMAGIKNETKDIPISAESSGEKAPEESLEDFLSQTAKETENVQLEDKGAQDQREKAKEEKRLEAFRALKPKIDQLIEMISQQKLFDGKDNYFALTNNFDGYKQSIKEMSEQNVAASLLEKEIEKEYRDITGETFYLSDVPRDFQDEKYKYSYNGYASSYDGRGISDENLKNYMQGTMMTLQGKVRGFLPDINSNHDRAISNTPAEYVDNLKKVRDYHHSREYRFNIDDQKDSSKQVTESTKQIDDSVSRYDADAQGFSLGALEAGDMRVAAQALAFAESVQKMIPHTMQQFKERLSKLSLVQKKEFVTTFESEKAKYKV